MYPIHRGRRLRASENIRKLVREHYLRVEDLIYPLFVVEGEEIQEPISSLPGQYHFSIDKLEEEITQIKKLGILSVLLFGLPNLKDERGSEAYNPDGIVQRAIRKIKELAPELVVITDVCLCQYTSHGHCGVLQEGQVINDATLELLAKTALSHAEAGADIIAPSDMMDGRIARIRTELDQNGYTSVSIMSYSVKYASAFYGPFREAAHSAPQSGDRKSYQMDPANGLEALKEAEWDIEEGADFLMVKPAMAYMDIISKLKECFTCPIAAYNVSGEYTMIKLASDQGLLDEKGTVLELLTGMKRAGADLIITYFAKEVAAWLKG